MKQSRSAAVHASTALSMIVVIAFSFTAVFSGELADNKISLLYKNPFTDFFGGLFFFLCGLHEISFMRKGIKSGKFTVYCRQKGIILVLLGFVTAIWFPVQAFIVLGVLYFFTPMLARLNSGTNMLMAAAVLIIGFKFYSMPGWQEYAQPISSVNRGDFIPKTIMYGVFFSYYSFIPYGAYYLVGLVFGKFEFYKKRNVRRILPWAIGILLIAMILYGQIERFYWITPKQASDKYVYDVAFYPFGWLVHGALFAVMGICMCVLWTVGTTLLLRNIHDSGPIKVLTRMGRLKLTLYGSTLIVGAGVMFGIAFGIIPEEVQEVPGIIWGFTFFYIMACFAFTNLWRRYYKHGPLERYLMKWGGLSGG